MTESYVADSDADSNVVGFERPPIQAGERKMPRKKERDYTKPTCKHLSPLIDEDLRVVECGDCESLLDPVSVLLDIARNWGDYAAAQMGKELQSYRNAEWCIRQTELRERRTPEERDLDHYEITKRHNEHGCPPDRIIVKRHDLECYCGVRMSRVHHREFEVRVLAAQNPVRKQLGLAPTPPAKDAR